MNTRPRVCEIALASFLLSGSGLLIWTAFISVYVKPFKSVPLEVGVFLTVVMAFSLVLAVWGAFRVANDQRLRGMNLADLAALFSLLGLAVGYIHINGSNIRDTSARYRSFVNQRFLATAMHNYHADHEHLPSASVRSRDGEPLLSWRVTLLPYLEKEDLFKQFRLGKPWDHPHNKPLSEIDEPLYLSPSPLRSREPGLTYYQVFVGGGALFETDRGVTFAEIEKGDGFANTLMIVESGQPVPWCKPQDLPYDPDEPLPALGRLWTFTNRYRFEEQRYGFIAVRADGSTRFFSANTDEKVLRALITRNGDEQVDQLLLDGL